MQEELLYYCKPGIPISVGVSIHIFLDRVFGGGGVTYVVLLVYLSSFYTYLSELVFSLKGRNLILEEKILSSRR